MLIAFGVGRGAYIMLVERPERTLFAVHAPDSAWEDAMRWIARQPPDAHVLADPGHAWKHGTSVRAAGVHDVFLEEVKDSALAIYSRDVAARVVERTAAIGDFAALTAERARELARQLRPRLSRSPKPTWRCPSRIATISSASTRWLLDSRAFRIHGPQRHRDTELFKGHAALCVSVLCGVVVRGMSFESEESGRRPRPSA